MKRLIAGIILLMSSMSFAQIDSMITVKKSDLPLHVLQTIETKNRIENVGKWVGLGKEVGTAVQEGLGALTDEADKFSKTGVGKFTMFIIAFKILGYPIIQLVVGLFILLIGILVYAWYLFKYCKPTKCKHLKTYVDYTKPIPIEAREDNTGPDKKYTWVEENYETIEPDQGELDTRMSIGFVGFIVYVIICMFIIFVH